jgi:hypothetical protein
VQLLKGKKIPLQLLMYLLHLKVTVDCASMLRAQFSAANGPPHLLLQHVEECHLVVAHRLLLEECSDAQVHLLLQLLNLASSLGHLSLGNSLVLGGQVPEQQQQQVQQQQM